MEALRPLVRPVRVGLLAAVVAIVLGILGMHALNLHESSSMAPMSGMSGMSGTSGLDEPTSAEPDGSTSRTTVGTPTQPGHDMSDMVMLCAAMLVAAGFGLLTLLLLRRTPTSWTFPRSQAAATVQRLVPRRADTGPPSAWAFSVIRC